MSATAGWSDYFTLYTRSPCSLRVDPTVNFIFFETVREIKPRIVWGCHFVSFAISAAVDPSLRRSNWITVAFFDPSRASGFPPLAGLLLL